jgi:hypothetical protein
MFLWNVCKLLQDYTASHLYSQNMFISTMSINLAFLLYLCHLFSFTVCDAELTGTENKLVSYFPFYNSAALVMTGLVIHLIDLINSTDINVHRSIIYFSLHFVNCVPLQKMFRKMLIFMTQIWMIYTIRDGQKNSKTTVTMFVQLLIRMYCSCLAVI